MHRASFTQSDKKYKIISFNEGRIEDLFCCRMCFSKKFLIDTCLPQWVINYSHNNIENGYMIDEGVYWMVDKYVPTLLSPTKGYNFRSAKPVIVAEIQQKWRRWRWYFTLSVKQNFVQQGSQYWERHVKLFYIVLLTQIHRKTHLKKTTKN